MGCGQYNVAIFFATDEVTISLNDCPNKALFAVCISFQLRLALVAECCVFDSIAADGGCKLSRSVRV